MKILKKGTWPPPVKKLEATCRQCGTDVELGEGDCPWDKFEQGAYWKCPVCRKANKSAKEL